MDLDACKLLFVLVELSWVLYQVASWRLLESRRSWDFEKDRQESYSPKEHKTLLKESDMTEAT